MDDITLAARTLDLAIAIQQIPAPTFHEAERARFMQQQFVASGLADVSIDNLGNVYGRLPGSGWVQQPLVVSAHIDTVFPAGTDLRVRREADRIWGPGIGDNSLGVAGLLGLVWSLRRRWDTGELRPRDGSIGGSKESTWGASASTLPGSQKRAPAGGHSSLPGDVWLVANVCEEGLGDLRGMRAVVDRFGKRVLAYLVLEGMALGQVYHRGLGVRRYRVWARTAGGHSWVDHGKPSAIHELAALVTRLTNIPLPAEPRTTTNVGVITGGTSVNTIAAEACLELDLRSEGLNALEDLIDRVEVTIRSANRPGVQVSHELIGERPVGKIAARHPLVRLVQRSLEAQGLSPNLSIGSTDANIPLSRGLPAVCLGLSTGGGAHTLDEYVNIQPVARGLAQLTAVVEGAFREL